MMRTVKDYEKLSEQYNKMLEERNSLIDDLSWYKAKVSRLEQENEIIKKREDEWIEILKFRESQIVESGEHIMKLDRENEKLRSRLDEFLEHDYDNQELYKENRNLLSEFSQHIGNKPSSSTYKYFRAKLDELGIKEGE